MPQPTPIRRPQGNAPDRRRRYMPPGLDRWTRTAFGSMRHDRMYGILRACETGEVEEWVDTTRYILRTDGRLRALVMTRINAVAGAELRIEAARAVAPGDEQLADEGAELYRERMDRLPDRERFFADLLDGWVVGWAGQEHQWERESGAWWSYPTWIHPRDLRFANDWKMQFRDTRQSGGTSSDWLPCGDYPDKFILHVPRNVADWPQLTGELFSVAWLWLFARWCEKFRQGALERFSNPLMYGIVPENTDPATIADLKSNLENLSATHAAVFKGATSINLAEAGKVPADAWTKALEDLRREQTIALLGSDLNTAVGDTGGAYNLGVNQFVTTTLPRLRLDAMRLGGTLMRDDAEPHLRLNSHLFGGRVPPTPQIFWELVQDSVEPPLASIAAGVATVNEIRTGDGLDPLDEGGDRVVPAPTAAPAPAPGFSGGGPGGDPAPAPLAPQRAPQLAAARSTKRRRRRGRVKGANSQIGFLSETSPLVAALTETSVDRER